MRQSHKLQEGFIVWKHDHAPGTDEFCIHHITASGDKSLALHISNN